MEHFAKKWSCIFRTLLFIGLSCFNLSVQSNPTASEWPLDLPENYTTAYLNITYSTANETVVNEISETGRYVMGARITSVSGVLVHVNSIKNGTINHYGCDPIFNEPKEDWIALVKRGMCDFQLKLENAFDKKAVGMLVYDGGRNESLIDMKLSTEAIPVIFTFKSEGERIANLTDGGTRVFMNITVGQICSHGVCDDNGSLLILNAVLLALFLLINYSHRMYSFCIESIRRFRRDQEEASLAQRRCEATKRALEKTATRKLEHTDEMVRGVAECCICLEFYKAGDMLRTLLCRHEFHEGCVDRWLLVGHPKCPLCQMGILTDIKVISTGRQDNILN
ncbi:unnamed protein product [Orchesella dallaii]|uniref:RING-type domain-containing protein n=1 Tax=Orchesella dallaii TaxID=48710 RepID=A0ABP1RX08_9HEXA